MVGHLKLAEALKNASILLYPCQTFAETFCIAVSIDFLLIQKHQVIKAAAAGCLLVTTRIAALDETVHPNAYTVAHDPNSGRVNANEYLQKTLEVMRRLQRAQSDAKVAEEIRQERLVGIKFASQFTWNRTVRMWLELHDSIDLTPEQKKQKAERQKIVQQLEEKTKKIDTIGGKQENAISPSSSSGSLKTTALQQEEKKPLSKTAKKNKKHREKEKLKRQQQQFDKKETQ